MKFILIALSLVFLFNQIECANKQEIVFRYKSTLVLDCSDLGDDVAFYRVEGENVTKLETDNKKTTVANKTLTIVDLRREEIQPEYYCESSSDRSRKIEFVKNIAPYLFKPEKQSQTITQGGSVEFSCSLLYGTSEPVVWTWTKNNSDVDIEKDSRFTVSHNGNSTKLTLKGVLDEDKGSYICNATSRFGSHSEAIQLRVKDTLAALWPFLAIVVEVLVLCVIILVYEKKCAKKPQGTEEDKEQTESFLNKDGSADVKKRAVKA